MDDTRALKKVDGLDQAARRRFTTTLLNEVQAVEQMLAEGMFERGVARIGAEQEIFLVDRAYQPAGGALRVLERVNDPHYTTELGLFNLEMNADPQPFAGKGLAQMEEQLAQLMGKAQKAAGDIEMSAIMCGILPTIGKTDLGLHNMVPSPRYQTLNRAMNEARGESFDFSIKGLDELVVRHDSVMVESCNASFQVHLQLAEPERFAHYYNVAQLLLAPVLAVGTNSPVLFGRRLWSETRIALFEQACDIRVPGLHLRDSTGRVSFGREWLKGGVADIYKDNVARFRVLVGGDGGEADALGDLKAGRIPELKALRIHNGTIYRWNRACYGISENGKPHLRIELRILPSGPSIADEVANGAFWLGLMSEMVATLDDIPAQLDFAYAQANFYAAAREGLGARLQWLGRKEVYAKDLVLDTLLPMARAGLSRAGVDDKDADRYMKIIEQRTRMERTGSRWMLLSLKDMGDEGTPGARQTALVAATIDRQKTDRVIAEWELAKLSENDSERAARQTVAQYMRTNLVTVQPGDPVELAYALMTWHELKHVAVEDDKGLLLGLISRRAVERHVAANGALGDAKVPVEKLMRANVVTVTPDVTTLAAIALASKHKISCVPVVQDGHFVAMLTEEDFRGIASRVRAEGPESAHELDQILGEDD